MFYKRVIEQQLQTVSDLSQPHKKMSKGSGRSIEDINEDKQLKEVNIQSNFNLGVKVCYLL